MNELTFEDFSNLKKEEQLNKLKEEWRNNKANDGELKICNLLAVHQLSKKQLKLIFQADRMFFSKNVKKFLDICEEKFNNNLPISFIQDEIKDIGVITLLASVMEINASADMLVEYLNLATLEWARNRFGELRTAPTTDKALEELNSMIKAIEGTVSSTKYYNISDDIMSMFEYYDNATKVMKSGIKSFDDWFLLEPTDVLLIGGQSGTGKCLPLTSKLYAKDGYILMKDVKAGDKIFGEDGKLHKVVGVFPQGKKQKVRVTFSDNTFTDCCEDHLWSVYELTKRPKSKIRKLTPQEVEDRWQPTTLSVKEMIEKGWLKEGYDKKQDRPMFTSKFHIPITKPVEFEKKEHYVDPYLLGILIGDGYLLGNNIAFSTNEEYIYKKVDLILNNIGYEVKRKEGDGYRYRITNTLKKSTNKLKQEICRLGIKVKSHEKFIPDEYKFDSVKNRLALLRGIFDTDGCVKGARTFITTISKKLKDDIIWLCQSLGMTATVAEDIRDKYVGNDRCYNISIQFNEGYEPFTSPKHYSRYTKPKRKQFVRRHIRKIEYLDEWVEMQCIAVDNPSKLYLTDNFTVTHNTAFSLQLVDGLVNNGNRGIFFSLEMNNIQLYRRLIAMKASLNISKLMTSGSFSQLSKVEFNKFNEALSKIKSYGDRLVMCYEAQNLLDIISITKKENAKKKLDFIVVDYVQLVSHKSPSEIQRITEISLELKRLAKELGIVVIGLSQLSRKRTDGTDMTALKGSSQLENDASQILILKSEFEDEEEQDTNDIKPIVANANKNRNGRVGRYRMMFNKPMQQFIDVERRK